MADLTIRNLDDTLIVQLKRKAWYLGLPFEEALRRIVIASLENDNDESERVPMPRSSYYVAEGEASVHRFPFHA